MDDKEQEKPLAHAPVRIINTHENDPFPGKFLARSNRKWIKCCSCFTAILLILVTTILILFFTLFRVRDPVLTMNSVRIEGLDATNMTTISSLNLTILGDVSMKNPNIVSFKYNNATTYAYYDGFVIGEAMTPEGQAKAQRTIRLNVTMDIMVDSIIQVPRFTSDFGVGVLPISTYTRIDGKVEIANIIKRRVIVTLNCTMGVNISSEAIQNHDCMKHISL